MKENNYSLKVRVLAFITLIPFTLVSCPLPSSSAVPLAPSVPSSPGSGEPIVIPNPPVTVNGGTPKPVSFYLTDDYLPSETDTGKTAFILEGVEAVKDFVITAEGAEDEEKGTVVRFLAGGTGTVVSLYFDRNVPFPRGFAMNSQGETTYGVFSDYDPASETFALTLKVGGEKQTFPNIIMNKNVLAAYTDNPDFTPGQNGRMRDYVTALGVWTALTLYIEAAMDETQVSAATGAAGSSLYGINASWIQTKGAVEAVGRGFQKAIDNISTIGKSVAEFFVGVFAVTAVAIVLVGTAVGATIAAPVVAIIAGVTAVVATVIYLGILGMDDSYGEIAPKEPGEPDPEPRPPEQRNAPLLRFYYLDETGAEQLVPVIQTGAETSPAQSVYITPTGIASASYVSSVRFYYQEARAADADRDATDITMLDFVIVPYDSRDNLFYKNVTSGTDERGIYIEVKKSDGSLDMDDYYGRQMQLVVTVYDNSQPGKPPYPCFYANGTEFNGAANFVINFFDYLADATEEAAIHIPPHTVEKTPPKAKTSFQSTWLDLSAVWIGVTRWMDSTVATNGVQ
jgi:hypothetical protein